MAERPCWNASVEGDWVPLYFHAPDGRVIFGPLNLSAVDAIAMGQDLITLGRRLAQRIDSEGDADA